MRRQWIGGSRTGTTRWIEDRHEDSALAVDEHRGIRAAEAWRRSSLRTIESRP
jgi:hypothetical protein